MNTTDSLTFNQAVATANTGDKRTANTHLKTLLSANPTDVNLLLWTAFTSDDLNHAGDLLDRASAIEPGNPALAQAKVWLAQERARQTPLPLTTPNNPPPPAFSIPDNTYVTRPQTAVSTTKPNDEAGTSLKTKLSPKLGKKHLGLVAGGCAALLVILVGILALTVFHQKTASETYYYEQYETLDEAINAHSGTSFAGDRVAFKFDNLASTQYKSIPYKGGMAIGVPVKSIFNAITKGLGSGSLNSSEPQYIAAIFFSNKDFQPRSGKSVYYGKITGDTSGSLMGVIEIEDIK